MLMFSFSHHYWLKNRAGSDLVREIYPCTWTLEKTKMESPSRADNREVDGFYLRDDSASPDPTKQPNQPSGRGWAILRLF